MKNPFLRGMFALLIALSLAVIAGAQSPADPQAGPRPLRVMTFNTHHGAGNLPCTAPPKTVPPAPDCNLNLDAIAEVIRTSEADVVGLQEVDRFWARSGYVDQPEYLARELRMFACYGANLDHQPDSHANVPHQYGTAILSRFPILECTNTFLPKSVPSYEQRGLLAAVINVRGVPFHFYNTHLDTHAIDRPAQVQAIVNLIGTPTAPVVLVGDLNTQPTEAPMPPLNALLQDGWVLSGAGTGYTYPAHLTNLPNRRIDYIFVSAGVAVPQIEVLLSQQTREAADHYPVAANIELPGSEVGIGRK